MEIEFILFMLSILFLVSIYIGGFGYRFGIPALLLFLGVGMLFGSDGLGLEFENIDVAETIGIVALCIILFSGGLDTDMRHIYPVISQGIILATVGVLITALVTGILIWWILGMTLSGLGVGLISSLLLASTMSSTDSASVFSILRSRNLYLRNNLRPMLELESGSNDPMAYVLVITFLEIIQANVAPDYLNIILYLILQLSIGAVMGFLLGKGFVYLINRLRIGNISLYPILVLSCGLFIFSATYFIKGNCYLAVYIAGVVIGNAKFPGKRSVLGFMDGISWLFQMLMFLTLGLLVNPHELVDIIIPGLLISLAMIFITRPFSVYLSLIPFRKMSFADKTYVSWVGLRGAVPIIFAIMILAAGIPHARLLFNIVFFCTLVSLLVQGTSLPMVAKWLGVIGTSGKLKEPESFDIDFSKDIKSVVTEINLEKSMLNDGNLLKNLRMPEKTLVIMIKREEHYFVPTGISVLQENDKLLIVSDNQEALLETYKRLGIKVGEK